MKVFRPLAVLATLALLITACTGSGSPSAAASAASAEASAASADPFAEWPDQLVMGFVPSREAGQLVDSIDALTGTLAEGLSEMSGKDITVEGTVPSDYTGLVTAMETDQAHIGAFGPFSLLQARDRAGAEIILQSERFGSPTYHTQFMTNNPDAYCDDEPVVSDEEAGWLNCNGTADADQGPVAEEKVGTIPEGTTVAFVEQSSASGYIFPATIFLNNGIDPETDVDQLFSGGHDRSVIAVCDGTAEVGVSFDDARGAAETNCDVAANVVVFAYGPEIPNDGWAVAGDLPQNLKDAIKQILLDYAATEEGQATLFELYEIDNLVEADPAAFEIVEQAAEQLGVTTD
jgi:phosphonate transport system substrate-binding protein